MKAILLKYGYWLLPIAWMGIIYYSSATPYQEQNMKPFLSNTFDLSFLTPWFDWINFTYHHSEVSVAVLGIEGFIEFFVRKGAHVGVFFVLMCLFYLALHKMGMTRLWKKSAIGFVLTVAYAGLDEFHQSFTANRTPYFGDVILDSFGALLAVICLTVFQRWAVTKQNRNRKL
ncbi:VanZ family protein [Virgibacillus kekensis]|uniref:VanZ family protein n=1 Tax=Virgibacillus kekensis TaxID=202261 RepID=A0ABV9DFP1_9BACI